MGQQGHAQQLLLLVLDNSFITCRSLTSGASLSIPAADKSTTHMFMILTALTPVPCGPTAFCCWFPREKKLGFSHPQVQLLLSGLWITREKNLLYNDVCSSIQRWTERRWFIAWFIIPKSLWSASECVSDSPDESFLPIFQVLTSHSTARHDGIAPHILNCT